MIHTALILSVYKQGGTLHHLSLNQRKKKEEDSSYIKRPIWQGLALHAVLASFWGGNVWGGVFLLLTFAMSKEQHTLLPFIKSLEQAMSPNSSCTSQLRTAVRLLSLSLMKLRPDSRIPYMDVFLKFLPSNNRWFNLLILNWHLFYYWK